MTINSLNNPKKMVSICYAHCLSSLNCLTLATMFIFDIITTAKTPPGVCRCKGLYEPLYLKNKNKSIIKKKKLFIKHLIYGYVS